jgi:hypothetical protein
LYEHYNDALNEIKLCINKKDIYSLKHISQKASELLDLIRISEILKSDRNILYYFPMILCFRGRTYYTSSISFTFYKEIRYCLHKGEYDINEEPEEHPLNITINEIIDKYLYKLENLKNYKFVNENIHNLRSVI